MLKIVVRRWLGAYKLMFEETIYNLHVATNKNAFNSKIRSKIQTQYYIRS